jgi:hypothetical protein
MEIEPMSTTTDWVRHTGDYAFIFCEDCVAA